MSLDRVYGCTSEMGRIAPNSALNFWVSSMTPAGADVLLKTWVSLAVATLGPWQVLRIIVSEPMSTPRDDAVLSKYCRSFVSSICFRRDSTCSRASVRVCVMLVTITFNNNRVKQSDCALCRFVLAPRSTSLTELGIASRFPQYQCE